MFTPVKLYLYNHRDLSEGFFPSLNNIFYTKTKKTTTGEK